MSGQVFHRRAEEFARLADLATDRPGAEVARQLVRDDGAARMVTVTRALRELRLDGDADPEFRDRLRSRLLAVAAVNPPAATLEVERPRLNGHVSRTVARAATRTAARIPARRAEVPAPRRSTPAPRRPQSSARLAFAVGALATLVLVCGLTLLASSRALPGDTLYAVKRSSEHLELALVHDPAQRGMRQLSFAQTRLVEITQLMERGGGISLGPNTHTVAGALASGNADLVTRALSDMDADTREGAALVTTAAVQRRDGDVLIALAGWTVTQRASLNALVARLPEAAATRAHVSLALLDRLWTRAGALRAELQCACLGQAVPDDLGPKPCPPCGAPTTGSGGQPGRTGPAGPSGPTAPRQRPGQGVPAPPPASTTAPAGQLPGTGTPAPSSSLPSVPNPLPSLPLPTTTTGGGLVCKLLGKLLCTS